MPPPSPPPSTAMNSPDTAMNSPDISTKETPDYDISRDTFYIPKNSKYQLTSQNNPATTIKDTTEKITHINSIEDINNLSTLHITPVDIECLNHPENLQHDDTTLIAKILAPKPINMNAFKSTIIRAWNLNKKVTANLLGKNTMAFIFEEKNDMEKLFRR
ncbi:hypothetical protein CASFOL_037103 [Castilleja foliolosa]|uniref:DUF4283 domain-containing protein n=1 Tax=Castilleja foliolosa TaxID=1961234 RepID=A0ABD3BN66_9LAMI